MCIHFKDLGNSIVGTESFETTRGNALYRGVVPGGAAGAIAPPDCGRSVNPISTRRGRLCTPYNTGTPAFSDLPTALICNSRYWLTSS